MTFLECKVPPPVVLVLCVATGWWISDHVPSLTYPRTYALTIAAALLFCSGVVVAAIAVWSFRKHSTTIHPHNPQDTSSIVVSGVYAFSRNPMYVGLAFVLIAFFVYLANPLNAFLVVVFIAYINRFQIVPEERILKEKFGTGYEAYLQKVRRWL